MEPKNHPVDPVVAAAQANYTRDELAALDNFLTTHPSERRLLKYLFEHKDETHTLESLHGRSGAPDAGTPVTLLDIKALVIYKLMEARDGQDRVIPFPIDIRESSQFRILPPKLDLIEAALQRRNWSEVKPGKGQ